MHKIVRYSWTKRSFACAASLATVPRRRTPTYLSLKNPETVNMGCGASTAAPAPVTEKAETVAAAKEATAAAGMDLTSIFGQFDTSGDGFLQMDEVRIVARIPRARSPAHDSPRAVDLARGS